MKKKRHPEGQRISQQHQGPKPRHPRSLRGSGRGWGAPRSGWRMEKGDAFCSNAVDLGPCCPTPVLSCSSDCPLQSHQIARCNLIWCIPAMSWHLLDMVLHLLATPWHLLVTSWHLLATPWHLPATSLHLRTISQHLLVSLWHLLATPWHLLAIPQNLMAISWHLLVTLWNVLVMPWHLLAISHHLLITPEHPLATSWHLLATPWHLQIAMAPSPAWKLSRQGHHPQCPAGDIMEVTSSRAVPVPLPMVAQGPPSTGSEGKADGLYWLQKPLRGWRQRTCALATKNWVQPVPPRVLPFPFQPPKSCRVGRG